VSLVNALFTATSATCVTGLVVLDTGKDFTRFGQGVILALIQVGGLGIMTFSTFFMYMVGHRVSIRGREIVEETLAQEPIRNLASLLKIVFFTTVAVELVGAGLLSLRFLEDSPPATAIYYGLFHSIAAFCNAGFSLYSDNLARFVGDAYVNLVVASLIILGGLGFIVVYNLRHRLFQRGPTTIFYRLSFHSVLVLLITAVLIVGGVVIFFALEYQNILKPLSWPTKVLASFFQVVTPRTAGFNTLEIGSLTNSTLFFLVLLMYIGASPGSTGGGIKTTTLGVLVALFFARLRNREDVNLLRRRVPNEIVSKAVSIAFFSALIIMLFTFVLLITEYGYVPYKASRGSFLEMLFEVTSAFGTVGLSTGLTPSLTSAGKVLLSLVMFIGRLGPLTIAIAVGGETKAKFKYAQERFLVG